MIPVDKGSRDHDRLGSLRARRLLLDAALAISREELVVGTVGNVSVRVEDMVLVTPTRMPYAQMGVEDLVAVSLGGNCREGRDRASRELPLHIAVYQQRPDVRALIHTHSPYATAWSFLGEPLLPCTEEAEYYAIGPVLTNPPSPSGSPELAVTAARCLGDSAAVLLGRHGVLAAAGSLDQALDVARVVERQAQVAWILRSNGAHGGANSISGRPTGKAGWLQASHPGALAAGIKASRGGESG